MAATLEELSRQADEAKADELDEQEAPEETQDETAEADATEEEETEGEPAEPETEGEETEQPEVPALDAGIRQIALQSGFTEADIEALGTKEAIYAALSVGQRVAQQQRAQGGEQQPAGAQQQQEAASESPQLAELDLEKLEKKLSEIDADDPAGEVMRDILTQVKSARDAIAYERQQRLQIEQQFQADYQARQQQQFHQLKTHFDSTLDKLESEAVGKSDKLNSAQTAMRSKIWDDASMLGQIRPEASWDELVSLATLSLSNGSEKKPASNPTVRKRSKSRQGGQAVGNTPPDPKARLAELSAMADRMLDEDDY